MSHNAKRERQRQREQGRGRRFWFAAPLAICLPCLLPFILAAVLTGVGVGAAGSFLSDNAFLLAILIAAAMLVALVIGLGVSRLTRWRRGGIRFLSRDG